MSSAVTAVEHGDVHALALGRSVPRANSAASTPCAANRPGRDVGDRDAEPERRAVLGAGDAHQAAFGLHHRVVAGFLRRGPDLAESRDRAVDQARMPARATRS